MTYASEEDFMFGVSAVHAYPDGFTCAHCGIEHTEETIDVEDLCIVNTDNEGTICLKCYVEENLKLIAAAPELLETLKDISVWLTAPATDKATIDHWKQKVSTAIAKATGDKE